MLLDLMDTHLLVVVLDLTVNVLGTTGLGLLPRLRTTVGDLGRTLVLPPQLELGFPVAKVLHRPVARPVLEVLAVDGKILFATIDFPRTGRVEVRGSVSVTT